MLPNDMRTILFLGLALALAASACDGCDTVRVSIDGGSGGRAGGGGNGGSAGTGGGGGGEAGGGTGGSGGGSTPFDAGDAFHTVEFDPTTLTLDGGPGGEGTGLRIIPGPDGGLVLTSNTSELYFMWIANAGQGTVSKYDTRTGKEVGRYYAVIPKDCANSLGPPCSSGNVHGLQGNQAHSPSRTAIDLTGDVWIANRAPGLQGSVTKVANERADCLDRNANGRIDTSRDLNNDGEISTDPDAGEMIIPANFADPIQYDECVLFTTPVGAPAPMNEVAGRALAIGAGGTGNRSGDVWLGIYHERRFYKLNPKNGQPVAARLDGGLFVELPVEFSALDSRVGAYGALVDGLQRLWAVYPGGNKLAVIDTLTGNVLATVSPPSSGFSCASYGFAVDSRNRIWLPSWTGVDVCRYDRATDTWTSYSTASARSQIGTEFGWGRGIAVSAPVMPAHPEGIVYMSGYLDVYAPDPRRNADRAQLIRLDARTGAIIPYGDAGFIDATDSNTKWSIGVGLDGDGEPWINNYSGNAMKIANADGAITRTRQQAAGLYTYSDFTGYQARTFTAPLGFYKRTFEACADATWRSLSFDSNTPPSTTLQAYVRVGDTLAALDNAANPRFGAYTTSPVDLAAIGIPHAKYLRVEFELRSNDGSTTPVLRRFNVSWSCPSMGPN